MLLGIRWGGLRFKIIAWSFVPTVIILLAVALVTFFAFQSVTEDLVLQRDLKVTLVSAGQLASNLTAYEDLLASVARMSEIYQDDAPAQRDALKRVGNRLAIFNGGVLLLDAYGTVVATEPERPGIVGQDWSDRSYYQELVSAQMAGAPQDLVLSDIVGDGPEGTDVIACALPMVGEQEQFYGMLVGMFRVGPAASNALYGELVKLRLGESGSIYLVDGNGRVIYHSSTERIGQDIGAQEAVQQVLEGQVDAIRTDDLDGNDIVAGFAPVPGTNWGLITEETWAALTSSFRGYRNFLLVLLALGIAVPVIVVGVGVKRITQPITDLINAAREVARGNFGQTITAKTGDEIEELAQQFNLMSAGLKESYTNLEQKVADRTRELAMLNTIAAVVSRSLDLDEILNNALGETLAWLEVEAGSVLLLEPDGETMTPRVQQGFSEEFLRAVPKLRLDEGIAGQAVAQGKPVVLDVPDYPTQHLAPLVVKEGIQTLASTPLLHKGRILGVMNLATRRPRAFPPQDLELLTSIGNQIGVAIENARLYRQTQEELGERKRAQEALRQVSEERARRNRELMLLNRVIAATTSRLEIEAVLEAVCRELTLAFNVPSAGAALLDEAGVALTVIAEHKSKERPSALGAVIPVQDNPATQYVLEHRAPLAITDTQHDPRMAPIHGLMRQQGVVSMLILPLIVRDKVVGTIGLDTVERREFSDQEIALAGNAAAAAAQALKNARAEEALRENEERLKLAMEGAGANWWDLNLAVSETFVIQDWIEDLGYEADEISQDFDSWHQLVHPDDRLKIAETWDKHMAGEIPRLEVEYRARAKSGDWIWFLLHGRAVVRDEHGGPLRVTGISQNINARKEAEEALRTSRQRLALHIQHTPLAYIEWDADLRVIDWNPAAERIFGYSKQEAQNCHAYEIIVPAEVQPHVTHVWQSVLKRTGGTRSTNENITKDGRTIVCEWYNTPLIDRDGKIIGLASLVQDITQRVQAEEELREAKAAAEAAQRAAETANQAKSAFLANMSHELRTPLNAILGFAQLMTRESLTGDSGLTIQQKENLEIIGRSGEHLLGLINDVLELSKIEAGRVTLHSQSFDLHRLLDGLEEMFFLRATEKGLMLIFDRAPDVPQFVHMDEGKLRQVLMNILGNAVKFTVEGGVTLRAGYSEGTSGPAGITTPARLLFEIEDTGPGIAPEELDAVFDPFKQTTSGQMSQEGTGLGMPISRQFVRLMGSDLLVRSEVGKGSFFKFDVPVELADATDVPASQPVRRVVGLEADQPVYRLLIAEDRDANRRLLVKLLTGINPPDTRHDGRFEVREAVNGQEALDVWENWDPHLIWMDLRMPVMDGYEATKRIKATTKGQATVIVALTASAFEEDRQMILSGKCDDFIRKPFREEEIFDALARHLGVRFVLEEPTEEDVAREREAPETLARRLSPDDLAGLPINWVNELHQAATQLDADVIMALVERIRTHNAPHNQALADALASLVHNYRFDTIMTLTEPVEGHHLGTKNDHTGAR